MTYSCWKGGSLTAANIQVVGSIDFLSGFYCGKQIRTDHLKSIHCISMPERSRKAWRFNMVHPMHVFSSNYLSDNVLANGCAVRNPCFPVSVRHQTIRIRRKQERCRVFVSEWGWILPFLPITCNLLTNRRGSITCYARTRVPKSVTSCSPANLTRFEWTEFHFTSVLCTSVSDWIISKSSVRVNWW